MSLEGWIKIHRCIEQNDIWLSEPFSRGQAWVDLILLANHKESFFYKRGNKVVVKRGQVGRSEVELADRWRWSRTKVRKFLEDLQKEQQIEIIKSPVTQLVTIINYDVYQEKEQQTGQQKDSKKTTEEQQKNTYKNDKNIEEGKEEKENYIYLGEFRKIEKGEQFRTTALENHFHFGLFKKEWSENFQNQILRFWRHLEEKKGDNWGTLGTITSQIDAIKSYLQKFSEVEIIEAFEDTRLKGNVSWNPEWTKKKKEESQKTDTQQPAYELPPFQTPKQREAWFFAKYHFYCDSGILENRLINTEYRRQAYEKRQPEALVLRLESEFPKLLELNFKNEQWQAIQ